MSINRIGNESQLIRPNPTPPNIYIQLPPIIDMRQWPSGLKLFGPPVTPISSVESFISELDGDNRYQHHQASVMKFASLVEKHGFQSHVTLDARPAAYGLMYDYLSVADSYTYNQSLASQMANRFIDSLNATSLEYIMTAAVAISITDLDNHFLPNNLSLRRADDTQVSLWWDVQAGPRAELARSLLHHPYTLDRSFNMRSVNDRAIQSAIPSFQNTVTALRVFKEFPVTHGRIYLRPPLSGMLNSFWFFDTLERAEYNIYVPNPAYEILHSDIPQLDRVVVGLGQTSRPKRYSIAIDRLNTAASREHSDDKLLDLVIALEALYGDGQGANSYKIAMRAAAYVYGNLEDRYACFELVKKAYDERSKLVHGGAGRSSTTTRDVTESIHALTRDSIRLMADDLVSGQQIPGPEKLDRLLLG